MSASAAAAAVSSHETAQSAVRLPVDVESEAPNIAKPSPLYRDLLHHLLPFLDLKELALVARTHKPWLRIASTMRSRGVPFSIEEEWQWESLCARPSGTTSLSCRPSPMTF
jgi:hypothetical protein